MHGRNAQVARIYRILNLLEGSPQGLSAYELHQRLAERDVDVSKRTVYRDLEALSDAGFPLFPKAQQSDKNATRWVLERSAKINQYLALSAHELFALYLARGMLVPLKDTPLHADLERVFRKIEEKLGTAHRDHFAELASEIRFESNPSWGAGLDNEVFETVRAACAEGQVLSVDYESVSSQKKSRRALGPHFVYLARGSVYLVAEDLATSETKVFSLPRMSNAVMEERPFERKPIDHEKFFEASFGVFRGGHPVEVLIEFSKTISPFVKERRWHASQQITTSGEGRARLRLNVALTPELVQWVLGFGAEAQVLEPEDLRARMRDSIARMAARYAEPKP